MASTSIWSRLLSISMFLIFQAWMSYSQRGCQDGFVQSNSKCYKLFKSDGQSTWETAKSVCEANGLTMAMPADEEAVTLRKDLFNVYGDWSSAWLSARGDGAQYVTEPDGRYISNTSPLWWPSSPVSSYLVSNTNCLALMLVQFALLQQPNQPYGSWICGFKAGYPLCIDPTSVGTAVGGSWGRWGAWGPCSHSCNSGFRLRTRICEQPKTGLGGSSCSGPENQVDDCNSQTCPINGPGCIDNDDSCQGWADRGECQKNPKFMLPKCPASCNQCVLPPVSSMGVTIQEPENVMIPQVSTVTLVSCGQSFSVDERIANGRPAISGQFPWMAYMSYYSRFHQEPVSCGGSLINERWVLTAAHCFRFLNPNIDVVVKLGYTDKFHREPESYVYAITLDDIITHGGFTNLSLDNDIAIMRLPEDVTFNRLVQPICLATDQQIPFSGKAVAAGWGLRKPDDDLANVLEAVELDVLEDESPRCGNSQLFICTFTPGKDTCRGDSGGPLMTKQGNTWFQIGIVSSGPLDCGNSNIPGTFTRVPNYIDFLLGYIRV